MYNPQSEEEKKFLESYDSSKYEKPSVTVDIVVFTISENNKLSILLIKRGGYPYKDKWAIPGGFVDINESIDDAAKRELFEETGLKNIDIEQIGTFGALDRDPRMRVISVSYMAFVPKNKLNIVAGDDASDAKLFEINIDLDGIIFKNNNLEVLANELAFDHEKIIKTAIKRLRNRIDYTEDAFSFLQDKDSFTIYELKKIYETVKGTKEDNANFRRMFIRDYVDTGKAIDTGETTKDSGYRQARLYKKLD